jgi:hypothetical protein
MAQKRSKPSSATAGATLANLRKLYGHHQLQTNVFGRRSALPSEIANQLRNSKTNAAIAVAVPQPGPGRLK